jgi:starch synthase
MAADPSDAIIRFEPDGYDIRRPWLMGRQVAGHGLLRAAVQGRAAGPMYCYTPREASAAAFANLVREIDGAVETRWLSPGKIAGSSASRILYLADPHLSAFARLRLREGMAQYSLCGVTHTTATPQAMGAIADLLTEPVAPWDALICTSEAVAETIRRVHEAQADYLRWRLGPDVVLSSVQLPVIPLGVHCADFVFGDDERANARRALDIGPDDIVALFVGRLNFTGKAHPFPMLRGLQAAAERSGRRVVLLQCGWAATEAIGDAFTTGAAIFAPGVRMMVVDGREDDLRRHAWAAGDLFISISDGIQETFGLTPIEAMAAGLPCVVSDWNGYKDTVRDGVDGFLVPTWAPAPGVVGVEIAALQERNAMNYDEYCWATSSATSVDMGRLVACLTDLIQRPDLRRRMGDAGRLRAREVYDWAGVFRQYQALWGELNARREAALADAVGRSRIEAAPRAAPSRLDPFHVFGHYPTDLIIPTTVVALAAGATAEAYHARMAHALFSGTKARAANVLPMLAKLEEGPATVTELAAAAGVGPSVAAVILGMLAKMDLVRLGPPPFRAHSGAPG